MIMKKHTRYAASEQLKADILKALGKKDGMAFLAEVQARRDMASKGIAITNTFITQAWDDVVNRHHRRCK